MRIPKAVHQEYDAAIEQHRLEVRQGGPSPATKVRRIAAIRSMHKAIAPDYPCNCPVCRDTTSASRETLVRL